MRRRLVALLPVGIAVPIVSYIGFDRFREIEKEARKLVAEIEKDRDKVFSIREVAVSTGEEVVRIRKALTSETVAVEPDKAGKAARSAQADPAASPIDRAISAAILFQQQGNIEKAMEKWHSAANVVDGSDDKLGARAWFSVGYLHRKESRYQEAVDVYDEAIRLKPEDAVAYYNRGTAKQRLGRSEDALADYDEAIRLESDYADAWGPSTSNPPAAKAPPNGNARPPPSTGAAPPARAPK